MPLDLKAPWTDTDLANLLASVTDDLDWRPEVSTDGIANLSDKTANPTGDDYDETLHCYFETWMRGTDFVPELSEVRMVRRAPDSPFLWRRIATISAEASRTWRQRSTSRASPVSSSTGYRRAR